MGTWENTADSKQCKCNGLGLNSTYQGTGCFAAISPYMLGVTTYEIAWFVKLTGSCTTDGDETSTDGDETETTGESDEDGGEAESNGGTTIITTTTTKTDPGVASLSTHYSTQSSVAAMLFVVSLGVGLKLH